MVQETKPFLYPDRLFSRPIDPAAKSAWVFTIDNVIVTTEIFTNKSPEAPTQMLGGPHVPGTKALLWPHYHEQIVDWRHIHAWGG